VELIIDSFTMRYPLISNLVRPIIIFLFLRKLRNELKLIALVVKESAYMILLIIIYILFFSYLGYYLFRNIEEGKLYFNNIPDIYFILVELLTCSYFPDIMLPAYQDNVAYTLYFIIYEGFGILVLFNLLLAVYFTNYKNIMESKIESKETERIEYISACFNSFDKGNKGHLSYRECQKFFISILCLKYTFYPYS
jgi:hypothetical protein